MKYLSFAFVIFFLTHESFAQVPTSWITDVSETSGLVNFHPDENLVPLDLAFNRILETNEVMFQNTSLDSQKKWRLQSIKTEIGLSAEGTIGLMGAGGEAALELVWIRKGSNKSVQSLSEEISQEAEEIQITEEMNPEALQKEITPIVNLAISAHGIKKRTRLLKNLMAQALKFQQTIKELEAAPVMGPWYAYKYQLELYVSAEGDIFFFEVGNSLRLRLEWWKLKKQIPGPQVVPMAPIEFSDNAKFLTGIASDLEGIGNISFENGFRLNCLKIGVGTTIKGNLVLVKGKASAIGSIFFKRDDIVPQPLDLPLFLNELSSYTLQEGNTLSQIPRMNFRSGIEKGAKMASFFASKAKKKTNSPFELNVIETELNLFSSGGIGMVSVENSAVLTLFVTRNVSI